MTDRVPPGLRRTVQPWLALLCRLLLAGLWLYAGFSKVTDLPGSVRAVNAYQVMPVAAGQVVGAALPFVEIVLGLVLLVGLGQRFAAITSALLLTVFVVGIASVWARGLRIDCGCFGEGGTLAAGQSPTYGTEIARDLALIAASAVLAVWPYTRFSLDGLVSHRELT